MVLTIPHSRHDSAEQILEQYRQQGPMFERFRKRISRLLEKKGMLPLGNRWISVVESHASGHPHMNVMIQGEGICSLLKSEQKTEEPSKSGKTFHLLHGEIAAIARACGFGRVSGDIQGCIKNALAYVLKTAKEMNKLLQLPMVAEKRFRRYRSGKGFLPKTFRQEKAEKRKAEGSAIGGCLTINSERYKARSPLSAYYAKKYSAARQFLEAARFLGFKGKRKKWKLPQGKKLTFSWKRVKGFSGLKSLRG